MLVFLTDFGCCSPYLAQVEAAARREAPRLPILHLFSDLPAFSPRPAAFLLPAYLDDFPAGSVFVCVVDPGVGSARGAVVLEAAGHWFVGPDNGLLSVVARRHGGAWHALDWRPERLSASFHGRDLFAPVGARLAMGERSMLGRMAAGPILPKWPSELDEVAWVDGFGNAVTGRRAVTVADGATVTVAGRCLPRARTFADVAVGEAFWYANSNGLVEVAVNQGSAAEALGLAPGSPVGVERP